MGYFLINEHMLPSVLAVRDKWLKKDGIIIPSRARLNIACFAAEDENLNLQKEENKGDSPIEAIIDSCDESSIVSTICCILDLDLLTTTFTSNEFSATVKT
jgi:predicted RNA methylase